MHALLINTTMKDEIVDITQDIEEILQKQSRQNGVCTVFVAHTTCGVTTADLDPGTDLDFLETIRKLLPKIKYRHPHDPLHTPDHILSSLVGPSVVIPFVNKSLKLGVWQRVVLIELNGPRDRSVHVGIS